MPLRFPNMSTVEQRPSHLSSGQHVSEERKLVNLAKYHQSRCSNKEARRRKKSKDNSTGQSQQGTGIKSAVVEYVISHQRGTTCTVWLCKGPVFLSRLAFNTQPRHLALSQHIFALTKCTLRLRCETRRQGAECHRRTDELRRRRAKVVMAADTAGLTCFSKYTARPQEPPRHVRHRLSTTVQSRQASTQDAILFGADNAQTMQ